MSVREVIISDFDRDGTLIPDDLSRGTVLIMFYADSCTFCQTSKPIFKQLAANSGGMKVAWIDFEKAQRRNVGLVREWPFKIEAYPTFVVFVNGVAEAYYKGPRTLEGFKSVAAKLRE